ncbi:MAG: cupin domain-containing protein [Burkholderiales bacterium]
MTCGTAPRAPGQVARAHKHVDMYEVFFVESGTGVIKVDGREQPLERGYAARSNLGNARSRECRNRRSVLIRFGLKV